MRGQIEDDVAPLLEGLAASYRVLLYAGNQDGSLCNAMGVGEYVRTLRWPGAAAFGNVSKCTWRVGGLPAGVVQSSGAFAHVTVINSGHLVPLSQPENAHDLIRRLVTGDLTPASMC